MLASHTLKQVTDSACKRPIGRAVRRQQSMLCNIDSMHLLEPFNKLLKVPEDPNDARYSLPDAVNDDGIMPNLLNDRLFYLVFYSMARRDRSGWPKRMFLREMYATNPGCLLEFSLKAQSHGHPNQWGLDAVESYLISLNLRSLATFESFLAEIEGRLRDQWLAYPFKSLLEQLRERLHGLRNGLASHCLGRIDQSSFYLDQQKESSDSDLSGRMESLLPHYYSPKSNNC